MQYKTSLRPLPWVAVWLWWSASACSAPLAAGIRNYDTGRYPEALQTLRAAEHQRACLSATGRVRYALYRGLAELALGNVCPAHRWLSLTQLAVRENPGLLSRSDRGRLASAWNSLGRMPGQLR